MNYSSQNSTHLTCTVCVERFDFSQDTSDLVMSRSTPHPHRWLFQEHPERDCYGELEEIDLNRFLKQSQHLDELTVAIDEGRVRQINLERTYTEERTLLKDLLGQSKVSLVSQGIQSLLSGIDTELANKIETLSVELADSEEEVKRISAELDEIRPLASLLKNTQSDWSTWTHSESRITKQENQEGGLVACRECQLPLQFDDQVATHIPSHMPSDTSSWCRNSNVALSAIDLRLIAGEGNTPSIKETSFGGALGEETGTSALWQDPKGASKDVKTTASERKAKPNPNRNIITPNDKAYWERDSVD